MSSESNLTYKVSSNTVFEAFDDEVVVINMVSGSYFAMDEVALGIWALIEKQTPLDQIVRTTQKQYQGDASAIEAAVKNLLGELEKEGLVVRVEGALSEPTEVVAEDNNVDVAPRPLFQTPVVSKFTDMQELLLLDPIHEVDEMGWPHAKAAPVGETPNG